MKSSIFVLLIIFALAFAVEKPTNYFASQSSSRGQQEQITNFAVWNFTSSSWMHVLPPNVGGTGSVSGIVAVGTGLLAYGSFSSIGGKSAAGLAYFDGSVWCTPEGVGLFSYSPDIYTTQFNNTPTGIAGAYAATVVGNDVYLLGSFNQVGLMRDGVSGFVKLTWSAGGIFSINKIGTNGYYDVTNSIPCPFCPKTSQPASGTKNKLLSYTANSATYFVFQKDTTGDLYQWQVDTGSWVTITQTSSARNITGKVQDFDVNSGSIYVVGNFYNLQDPIQTNQYMHIAKTTDQGSTWVQATSLLNVANFGDLDVSINNSTGIYLPALTGTGFSAIAVESSTSIYVAGGYRITERNITLNNLAGQLQTVIVHITASTYTVSERFANGPFGGSPNFFGPTIESLVLANGALYIFGPFTSYRQVTTAGSRFGTRMIEVYRGAAKWSNNQMTPAFGGYLTQTYAGDNTPSGVFKSFNSQLMFFYGDALSAYGILSGGVFAYGGNKQFGFNNRWNAVLSNQRFVSASTFGNGVGADGNIYALHITKRNDALIIGGQFDWIGSQRIGAIAAYDVVAGTVQQIGGGIYYTNQVINYFGDNTYNNRIGGTVYDIEEWDDNLIIAGSFNRNNSGNCVSNIAWNKFRVNRAGWEAIDGGCDGTIYDILVDGSMLYITGSFSFCGLNPSGYRGGLYRGSIPTSNIARIDLNDKKRSWRNLGVGLDGTGYSLAWRNGELFVGGDFTLAGGRIATAGIARWHGDHWRDVVAKCRGNCDRSVNVLPYIGTNTSPLAASRKPSKCMKLANIGGRIYCIDSTASRLAYFTSDTWYQAGDFVVSVSSPSQNSLIIRNSTYHDYILVPSTTGVGSNGANFVAYDVDEFQFDPSSGGFSSPPVAMAEGKK